LRPIVDEMAQGPEPAEATQHCFYHELQSDRCVPSIASVFQSHVRINAK
jgi:hypothetical protein